MTGKTKAAVGAMAVCTVGVVAMLVLSIPSWGPLHRPDFGMMTYCETTTRSLELVQVSAAKTYDSTCAEYAVEVHLGTPPFKVHAYTNNPHLPDDAETVARDAMQWVNGAAGAGMALTVWEDDPNKADIVMALGLPRLVDGGGHEVKGHTTFRIIKGMPAAVVRTSNNTLQELVLTTRHELLHAVGLGHDEFDASPMYPTMDRFLQGAAPYRLTAADRELLQSRY